MYLYFDTYLSCRKILKNLWGGLPIGGGEGDVVSSHSSFGLDPLESVASYDAFLDRYHEGEAKFGTPWEDKTHQVWQRRVKNLTPHDEIWLFIMSFPCMYVYVCVHACMHACIYVSVCLSIFLSNHLCISALVHTSIPCKTEIFARQKVMGGVRSFFQTSFFTRICQFLGCNREVWTFFGPPPKKKTCNHTLLISTLPRIYQKIPSRILPRCSSNANQQLPQRSTTTHNLWSPISIAVDGSINRW